MAVGSFSFPTDLSQSSVVGVAYGEDWCAELSQVVPAISLVAKDGAALTRAFATFQAWSEATDPDSLEVTIVFRSKGGYLLALSPEMRRLERRCLGFNRAHRPVVLAATWCKPIDSVHPFLRRFETYSKRAISPYLLGGAALSGAITAPSPPASYSIRPLEGLKPLLKFSVTFAEEASVEAGTVAWVALRMADGGSISATAPSGPPAPAPSEISDQRRVTLRTHFPVTLERLAMARACGAAFRSLSTKGIAAWQFEQAVCNLTLSRAMEAGLHYRSLPRPRFQEAVLQALSEHYEVADGAPLVPCEPESVAEQVLADANALLSHLKMRPARDLASAQARLRAASALAAPTANPDLVRTW